MDRGAIASALGGGSSSSQADQVKAFLASGSGDVAAWEALFSDGVDQATVDFLKSAAIPDQFAERGYSDTRLLGNDNEYGGINSGPALVDVWNPWQSGGGLELLYSPNVVKQDVAGLSGGATGGAENSVQTYEIDGKTVHPVYATVGGDGQGELIGFSTLGGSADDPTPKYSSDMSLYGVDGYTAEGAKSYNDMAGELESRAEDYSEGDWIAPLVAAVMTMGFGAALFPAFGGIAGAGFTTGNVVAGAASGGLTGMAGSVVAGGDPMDGLLAGAVGGSLMAGFAPASDGTGGWQPTGSSTIDSAITKGITGAAKGAVTDTEENGLLGGVTSGLLGTVLPSGVAGSAANSVLTGLVVNNYGTQPEISTANTGATTTTTSESGSVGTLPGYNDLGSRQKIADQLKAGG